jgi:group I intron endonuclease
MIRNTVNGKMYVGSAKRLANRWSVHVATLKKGRHHSKKLQRAWNKYGARAFVFEVLITCDIKHAVKIEQDFMNKLDVVKNGYNVHPNARSALGRKHNKMTRARMSASAVLVASSVSERKRRSQRAKAQHVAGKFGQKTWTRPARYNPISAVAGAKALKSCTRDKRWVAKRAKNAVAARRHFYNVHTRQVELMRKYR